MDADEKGPSVTNPEPCSVQTRGIPDGGAPMTKNMESRGEPDGCEKTEKFAVIAENLSTLAADRKPVNAQQDKDKTNHNVVLQFNTPLQVTENSEAISVSTIVSNPSTENDVDIERKRDPGVSCFKLALDPGTQEICEKAYEDQAGEHAWDLQEQNYDCLEAVFPSDDYVAADIGLSLRDDPVSTEPASSKLESEPSKHFGLVDVLLLLVVSFFITTWNHEDYTEHNPTQQTDSDVSEAEDKNEDGRGADGKVDDSESQMNSHVSCEEVDGQGDPNTGSFSSGRETAGDPGHGGRNHRGQGDSGGGNDGGGGRGSGGGGGNGNGSDGNGNGDDKRKKTDTVRKTGEDDEDEEEEEGENESGSEHPDEAQQNSPGGSGLSISFIFHCIMSCPQNTTGSALLANETISNPLQSPQKVVVFRLGQLLSSLGIPASSFRMRCLGRGQQLNREFYIHAQVKALGARLIRRFIRRWIDSGCPTLRASMPAASQHSMHVNIEAVIGTLSNLGRQVLIRMSNHHGLLATVHVQLTKLLQERVKAGNGLTSGTAGGNPQVPAIPRSLPCGSRGERPEENDDRFKPPVQCTDDLASLAQAVHTDPNTGPATAASTSTVTPILPRPLPGMVRPRPAFHIVEQSLQELQDLEDTVPDTATALEEENRSLRAWFMCKKCNQVPFKWILDPCGHLVCGNCRARMGRICDINLCQKEIRDAHQVRLS